MQYRNLPSVESVMATRQLQGLAILYQRDWLVNLVRQQIDAARDGVRCGDEAATIDEIAVRVAHQASRTARSRPEPVINATGVIIHTNLGRAPLSEDAVEAMQAAADRYTDLELDIEQGRRGSRQAHLQPVLRQLTGAESSLVVNNNASAVLLGLSAIARDKEVIVSRGEAVEIGGGFRVPDVLLQSGARLVEVGTTNRTYASDYESAITPDTGALLKVHASNFRVEGFTHACDTSELAELGKRTSLPVLHDVGSGCLLATEEFGLAHEPTPQESIAAGADLVFFSGDKLLGGPQAGIIGGKTDLVRKLERHPLARALRIDKLSLAALTATLLHYLKGEARRKIPIWQMIGSPLEHIRERADEWRNNIGYAASVCQGLSTIGGGSLPGETIPTCVVALNCSEAQGGPEGVMSRLRESRPPIIARIEQNRVMLDPRTVPFDEEDSLLRGVKAALSAR